ncbi:peptidylprolyl isomerase [Paenibacillus athensensis]|uniref:PpiC domain-containing protein n=1 Tax=Paenibacillus athensensis TaxID=1967502 RepID=A0A4Y8PUJ2_9BACL|nr:peptidylprolyl isomerase [Paenibacillus athensensis]MCD1261887.1 peptidylprolyl isomerase [Paenibacillus athensensis]
MLQNKMLGKKWLLAVVALLLAVSVLSACGKKKEEAGATGEVIATYKDNGKVTRAEYDTFVNVNKLFSPQLAQYLSDPAYQQELLKQLITFKILSARADDKVKAEADTKIQDQMTQLKDYLSKMEGGMDKQLKDNNIQLGDIENLLKLSFYSMMALESKVTDDQVQKAYDEQNAQHAFDTVTVSHILISLKDASTQADLRTKDEALARAKEVKGKLDAGGDFAALAKEYSDDPGSKDNGGTYKDADPNQWVPEFKQAALTLPLNTVSDPVESSFGYHVMKVEARTSKKLDEVKDQIKSGLAQQALSDFVAKDLPGLIETNTLPTPTPVPSASPEASAAPEATPAASPAASPAAQ